MKRIENYYYWEELWQWKYALDTNNLKRIGFSETQLSEEDLGKIVVLLLHNIFPIAIICYRESNDPAMLMTSVFEGIFSFLEGKKCALIEGKRILFEDMNSAQKSKILNAKLLSVWIEGEGSEKNAVCIASQDFAEFGFAKKG